jgi:hypothetical protein
MGCLNSGQGFSHWFSNNINSKPYLCKWNKKICNKCGKLKELEMFGRRANAKDGRRNECKDCRSINDKRLYPRYIKTNKNGYLRRTYGISNEEYEFLLQKRNYVCAICNKPETRKNNGKITDLTVDHCHVSGKIRGLLCQKCNSGIGVFKESLELLIKAKQYIEKNNGMP